MKYPLSTVTIRVSHAGHVAEGIWLLDTLEDMEEEMIAENLLRSFKDATRKIDLLMHPSEYERT